MLENLRLQYSNFANFFKRILNRKKKLLLGNLVTGQDVTKLQQELAALKPLVEREWLAGKVGELVEKAEE